MNINEELSSVENRERIFPGQILLLAEPIFENPQGDESAKAQYTVPLGSEAWVNQFFLSQYTGDNIKELLANEYLAIVSSLKEMGVSFRIIIAHRKQIDERLTLAMLQHFRVRGLALHESISETCFPRDMLVDFDGITHINPSANFYFPDNSGVTSPLGEGGRMLKLGKKVFIPDPRGFVKTRPKYIEAIDTLSDHFQFGFLPHPLAIEIDKLSNTREIFPNDHLDRVAALIKGKDDRDYLMLDNHYVTESHSPYGQYWKGIQEACQKLDVIPVVIDRKPNSIPYALNLEQFADGAVLLTGEDDLAETIRQIVGTDKVYTTSSPIIFYPILRNGGIRCMLLHAPQKIIGRPIIG